MKNKGRLLFVDLEKAFDKVDRYRLIRILQDRCKSDQDRHLVNLIRDLLSNTKASSASTWWRPPPACQIGRAHV